MPEDTGKIRDKEGRFVKGVSGNPEGRPVGTVSVVEAIRRHLKECPEGKDKTYLELMIKRIFVLAIQDGDVGMIKDIINRVDGMPAGFADKINIEQTKIDVKNELSKIDDSEGNKQEYLQKAEQALASISVGRKDKSS